MIDIAKRFAEVNNAHLDLYHFHFIIIRNMQKQFLHQKA